MYSLSSKEELEATIENGDCPQALLDLLDATPKKWRIGVAKQFIEQYNWQTKVEATIRQIKWRQTGELGLLVAVFLLLLKITLGV